MPEDMRLGTAISSFNESEKGQKSRLGTLIHSKCKQKQEQKSTRHEKREEQTEAMPQTPVLICRCPSYVHTSFACKILGTRWEKARIDDYCRDGGGSCCMQLPFGVLDLIISGSAIGPEVVRQAPRYKC